VILVKYNSKKGNFDFSVCENPIPLFKEVSFVNLCLEHTVWSIKNAPKVWTKTHFDQCPVIVKNTG